MLLFYIRHGEPIYEPNQLTPLGERQAEALARRLARYGLDEIYASPSNRAHQTAQPTADILRLPVTLLEWCREEIAWQELTTIDAKGTWRWLYQDPEKRKALVSPEVTALGDEWYTHPAFAGRDYGRSVKRIRENALAFLEGLGYAYCPETGTYRELRPNPRRIALFAHEGVGKMFLSTILGIPYPRFCTEMGLGHSSMTVIRFENEGDGTVIPAMLQLSNDSHLYAENLPTKYNGEIYF